ncbi:hypothetical protein ACLLS5_001958 [Salmonella enterica]|uniref:Uncharacterized protein n=5 Tax=Salmonella enterica TaxID=28901 RepID=A0A2X4TAP0_SALER|nr:hypothetical protein [Salmonella enterica]AIP98064.1 hypothetical protein N898_18600 [Salmonella enterica subsp. arizonae serovar 62:z36:- str. RKS2983]ASO61682.1 hypothetical protein LFZ50_12885 [Salmonella enterica subsp. arizonae serovar 53:-:- str. SA20100345]EAN8390216.1 hypothetical protein [Salmonella enterica subsp. arizonae serovar 13,23:gz51:-]EAN8609878.1 hypothetical protein [Salmonella enterica subsp. arizonae serovar 48:z4,z24:-]EAO5936119.1 hypothetical protein [Salmonella en
MLEWLNNHIGTDWATYLGVLLAILSLIWGGKKVLKNKSISQKAKVNGGIVIQVGGDFQGGKDNESKSSSK